MKFMILADSSSFTRKAANRTGNGGSGGSRELFTANRCEPEPEHFFLNRKRHEPELDLILDPFLILDPDERFLNSISLARFWLGLGLEAVAIRCKWLVSSLGVHF